MVYLTKQIGYNITVLGKEICCMEAVLHDMTLQEQQKTTSFSYLDKGIEDMEAGRVHSVDEAFQIIETRIQSDI